MTLLEVWGENSAGLPCLLVFMCLGREVKFNASTGDAKGNNFVVQSGVGVGPRGGNDLKT